jgi:hypothetical protein
MRELTQGKVSERIRGENICCWTRRVALYVVAPPSPGCCYVPAAERLTPDLGMRSPCCGILMTVVIGTAYREGLVGIQRRVRFEIGQWRYSTYPGLGPFSPEVKPLRPALIFIMLTQWLQCSLSCVV